ncbi:MAG: TolC family protein [Firmicutes bacterium]|nr:TolC family protein [Bacillota bacterium]
MNTRIIHKIKSGISGILISALLTALPLCLPVFAGEKDPKAAQPEKQVSVKITDDKKPAEAISLYDLPTCLSIAEKNNIQLKLSDSRRKTAEADALQARIPLNVKMDFNAGYTYLNPTIQQTFPAVPPAQPSVIDITTQDNYKANLTVTKTLTTFGRAENRIKAADLQSKAKVSDYEYSKSKIKFLVKQNYYYVLSQKGLADTASENLTLTGEQYDVAKKLNKEGVLPGFDVRQANLKTMVARQSFITQQNSYMKNTAAFLNLLGIDSARKDILLAPVSGILEDMPFLKDEQALINTAFENRDDIKSAVLLVESSRKHLASANASANPSVGLMAQYENHTKTAFSTQDQWTGMITLQIPVIDGGTKTAEVKKARENLFQAEQQLQQLKDDVKLDVIQSVLDYTDARCRYETSETEVTVAGENYKIALERYKSGISTNVELDSALNDLNSAKVRKINSIYSLQTAIAKLEYATGKDFNTGEKLCSNRQ